MKILNLSNNELDFVGFSNLVKDTGEMRLLETLILTNTFPYQMILPKLIFYYLSSTKIRELYINENWFFNATPEGEQIERLPGTLRYLDFSKNKLIDCRFDMPSLKQIDIQHNYLGKFLASESYAPMIENDTSYLLEKVDLSFNEIHDLKWSVFNNQQKLRIVNLSNNFLSDIAFDISQLTKLEMLDLSNNNITSISNMQAKEAITNITMKSIFKTLDTEGIYTYDAFISYSDKEKDFIIKECLPNLEVKRNLKLCIHQRDFIPGEDITVNITSAIHDSKKTICIMTRSFLDSYYCNFEFNMARMENIYHRNGQNILFLVFYEKIPAQDLSLVMLELVQKQSYIEYPNDEQGNIVFWDKIREAIE
ncbi:Toll-like receptor 4 [Mytilus edulis]|uniref:Toll-like receptor 4 n=1 Tax=Mytilus edulis TaxID=6550 RepID=A0A8S3PVU4_MYTED|nr:Toll-like receptor 4 [Mytilus edulis]